MERLDPTRAPAAGDDAPPVLSGRAFAFALAITLTIFLLANPIWKASVVREWDQNIWWSYAPIPLLVVGLLAWERKLGWGAFVLDTMKLTLVKFAITFVLANAIWAVWGPPGSGLAPTPPAPHAQGSGVYAPHGAPEVTPLDPARVGVLEGVVRDGHGAPVAGALVAITEGLEGHVFAAPREALRLVDDGNGFGPSPAIVRSHQPVELAGSDGVLHTAVFTGPQQFVLNHPVLPGAVRTMMFPRARGLLTLGCSVHAGVEVDARVLVLDHPFAARTDAEGRFRFEGVPSGRLQLSAWDGPGGEVTEGVSLADGERRAVTLALPAG